MRPWVGGLTRILLRCFPRDFRVQHGADVKAFWTSQSEEARYKGLVGGVRLAIHLVGDAVGHGVALRAGLGSQRGSSLGDRRSRFRTGGLGSDIRYAIRSLRRSPMFSAVAIVTLALGIGATTALFSVVNGVLLRPLPFPDSERLVRVERVTEEGGPDDVAWPDFRDWREQATGFLGMAAYAETQSSFTWDDVTESLDGSMITLDYFAVMGVTPALGRPFTPDEDRLDGTDAVILSDALWHRRLGGDPSVVGQTLVIDNEAVVIVGVMPPDLGAPSTEVEFWVPLQDDELLGRVGLPTGTRSLSFLTVVGRLADGEIGAVGQGMAALARRIDTDVGRERQNAVRLTRLQETVVGNVRGTLWMLMGAVLLVMIVACANVAGLSISRAATRERELAVRSALGAGAADLFRLLVVESLVMAAAAGALGIAFGVWLTRAVVALAPPGLPRIHEIGIAPVDLGFALVLTCVAALLFGIAPAVRAMGAQLRASMASGDRGTSEGVRALRPQRILVVLQVATSVVLLSAAALLANSLARLMTVERGFDDQGVLVATIEPSDVRYTTPEQIDIFYGGLLDRVRAIPGVAAATTTYSPPLSGNDFATRVRLESEPERTDGEGGRWAGTVIVRDNFFSTTGTPLLQGREFGPEDRLGEPPVVIVNQTMAETFWPGQDPIGQRFYFAGGLRGSADDFSRAYFPREPYTVVGVAGDVRRQSLAEVSGPEYYRPHRQITWGFQFLMVRTSVDPDQVSGALRAAIREYDSSTPVPDIQTLSKQVSESLATPRFRTLLLSAFAGLTSLLAMIGLYAVMAMAVSRRTREMGIRLALGASPPTLMRGVLGSGARLVALGIVVGLGTAYAGTRWIASMLYEVEPTDLTTYAVVVALTATVALMACYAPARRASRIDPVISLKA